jgi:hypothetical protein
MLLHIVLSAESPPAFGTNGILLSSVFLGMPGSMTRSGEDILAIVFVGEGTRV